MGEAMSITVCLPHPLLPSCFHVQHGRIGKKSDLCSSRHGFYALMHHSSWPPCRHLKPAFIAESLCWLSHLTYESAWQLWAIWCTANGAEESDFSDIPLIQYLWFLFWERDLASTTLLVHRVAILSLLDPLSMMGT